MTDRAAQALALRREGRTYWDIGRQLGDVSAERARQLCCRGLRQEALPDDAMLYITEGKACIPDHWPLALLPMTKPIHRALMDMNLETLGQLRRLTYAQLLNIPGVGRRSIKWLSALMADPFGEWVEETVESPRMLAKVQKLEADNARLRARLKRILAAAKYVADEEHADAMGTDPAAGAAAAPQAVVAADVGSA